MDDKSYRPDIGLYSDVDVGLLMMVTMSGGSKPSSGGSSDCCWFDRRGY